MQAHSCLRHHQFLAHKPQVRQRKHRLQLVVVFGYAFVANLVESELLLDDAKLVFDLGSDAGLALFIVLFHRSQLSADVKLLAQAFAHCHVPADFAALEFITLFYALIAAVTQHDGLLPVQQLVGLGDISGVAWGGDHGMHQP